MKHIVAGTAGHIDHGKTSLVRALTGIDTDRLSEEKRRGISIDLGFAHLQIGQKLRIAFIDVPGHEKFVKNMLAGVAGIDFVILVVAADESIKPQTREHFDICRLLGVERGIIVISKADKVDPELVDLVRMEVEEFVLGSFLEGAPVIPVSATSGQGLDELKLMLAGLAEEHTERPKQRPFRLAIDRAFSMRGFGTVVTGTARSGIVRVEDQLDLLPEGKLIRVRGLQVHGSSANEGAAGQRVALNVTGVDLADLRRGQALAASGFYTAANALDCRFSLLAGVKPLRNRTPVHLHIGTAEIVADVRFPSGPVEPGRESFVRFVLREPTLALPGDHFIARMFSPVQTIGGGVILDVHRRPTRAPHLRLKNMPERAKSIATASPGAIVSRYLSEADFGLTNKALMSKTGWSAAEVESATREARASRIKDLYVNPATLADWQNHLQRELAEFHKSQPLQRGAPKEELRAKLLPTAPADVFEELLAMQKQVVADGNLLRLATHKIALKEDESQAKAKIEAAFQKAGLFAPSQDDVLAASGVDQKTARTILQILLKEGKLVRVTQDLVFHESAIGSLKENLATKRGQRFPVGQFKDWVGVSRKYAIPLLEYLDREKITRREGDERVVL